MAGQARLAAEGLLHSDEPRILRHRPHVMDQTHWHSHIELFMLTAGRIWTELHGQDSEIGAGRLGLLWASYPHRVTRIEAPGDIYVLNIPLRRFRSWRISAPMRLAVMRGELVLAGNAVAYQERLFELWLNQPAKTHADWQDLMFDEAQSCVRRVDLNGWTSGTQARLRVIAEQGRLDRRVDRMIRFIDDQFDRVDLRVEHVAAEAGLHPNYAMAVFKQGMGISIGNYLTHVRLSEAQQLLLTTDDKILTVAGDCGFASPSRFYAAFQAHLGTTPTSYRDRAERQATHS